MKLYEMQRNTRICLLEDVSGPPGAPSFKAGDEVNFGHIDGMYSFCKDDAGNVVHVKAWAEVEVA